MQLGEIYKYLPTSTVGKVLDMRERDGKSWAQLDFTGLWYDTSMLVPADAIEDLIREKEEVDISEFTPSGGG